MRFLPAAGLLLGALLAAAAARADYVVKDGNGAAQTIKSQTVSGTILPQSVPSDPTGTAYSAANPLPVGGAFNNGVDYSANAPSLAGLTLLATIPAAATPRLGFLIQAQCTAGLTVAFDDGAGALTATIAVLAGPAANGGQGGSLSMSGMPHNGRIRIYSSSPTCQMAARTW